MENGVTINYSDYANNQVIREARFELFQDVILTLKHEDGGEDVMICMSDAISDNTNIEGVIDYDELNTLIKILAQLKNQIKMAK